MLRLIYDAATARLRYTAYAMAISPLSPYRLRRHYAMPLMPPHFDIFAMQRAAKIALMFCYAD